MRVLLIKGLLHFFALLPLGRVHGIATWLGRYLAGRASLRITNVTRTNIRLCYPDLSSTAQETLVKQTLIETCKTYSELGALWLWPVERVLGLVREVSGEEYLQQALQKKQKKRGLVILTPHFGAWEMAALYVSSRYQLTGLYRPPKLAGLHDLIHTARERAGGRLVPTNRAGVRALYQALQRGQLAGILPDQVPSDAGSGVFAPFFGIAAYTTVLVSRLAHKAENTVIFVYAKRLPEGQGFHIHFFQGSANIAAENLETACAALNQGIEQCVQTCPAQYQWSYKRFKQRPEGEESIY